jgi:hypothetical protein
MKRRHATRRAGVGGLTRTAQQQRVVQVVENLIIGRPTSKKIVPPPAGHPGLEGAEPSAAGT